MESVLSLITVNQNFVVEFNHVMTQRTYPFRVSDVALPQCNTGYVYMLISIKDMNFTYIGATLSIRKRIQQHNSGVGSVSTEPLHLRPYALLAYICGFNSNRELLYYIERRWKEERDKAIRNHVNNPKEWALCGNDALMGINEESYGVS